MVNLTHIEDYANSGTGANAVIFNDLKDDLLSMDRYISSVFKGNFIVLILLLIFAILFFFLPSTVAKVGCVIIMLLMTLHYFQNRKLAALKAKIDEPTALVKQLERCQGYLGKLRFYYGPYSYWGILGVCLGMLMVTTGSLPFFPFSNLVASVGIFIAMYVPVIHENRKYQNALHHTEARIQFALGILKQENK